MEYDWGETTEHTLAGMTSDEVDAEIKKIVTSKMNDAQYQGQREHRYDVNPSSDCCFII